MAENIYPIFEKMLQREDREALLKQKGTMIWFTGLSGSGKSTLAIALERELYNQGVLCRILDGDNIRSGINNNLGFSENDRTENIRRIAEVSKLFVDCGIVTLAAFISPTRAIRHMASEIIGKKISWKFLSVLPLKNAKREMSRVYMPKPAVAKSKILPEYLHLLRLRSSHLSPSIPPGTP